MRETVIPASALSLCVSLAGCYLVHERPGAGAAMDAAPDVSSSARDAPFGAAPDVGCGGAPSEARWEPATPLPESGSAILLLGVDADASVNGVRIHLRICDASPCRPVDLVVTNVGDAFDGITILDRGADGTMSHDAYPGATFLHVSGVSGRFEGVLNVLAGSHRTSPSGGRSSVDRRITFAADHLECMSSCGDVSAVRIGGGGGSVVVGSGGSIDTPLRARVATGLEDPCVRCDCAFSPTITGILLYDDHFASGM